MGFPLIQVFMIAARQVSKPVSEMVLKYGVEHPGFRNKILIPIGRSMSNLTTRLRMERLGLGKPVTMKEVSEATALEQASEFVQQVVIFTYSVGVFTAFYFYQIYYVPETVKKLEYEKHVENTEQELSGLRAKVEELERRLSGAPLTENKKIVAPSSASYTLSESSEPSRPWLQRISSLPIDAASRIIYGGKEYLVTQKDDKVCIEQADEFDRRAQPLEFRKKPLTYPERTSGASRLLHRTAAFITGWNDWEY